ncbi:MAG: DUF4851 domain-containing protein [Desulfovibrionaceae bacterium]|nr:DUF4851 domain-containing protein [Desulfovibrionaceae bacterium]
MKKTLMLLLLTLVCACSPMKRGVENGKVVSSSQPALTLYARDLPLLSAGRYTPLKYMGASHVVPKTVVAVYGTDASSPMAVTIFAETPNDQLEWDALSFSYWDSPVSDGIIVDGNVFGGRLYALKGDRDPFVSLVEKDAEKASSLIWLVQRYALVTNFEKIKIILEYREPLPAWCFGLVEIPEWKPEIRAFQERAKKTLVAAFSYSSLGEYSDAEAQGIDGRRLGVFLGSLSYRNIFISRN